MAENQLRWGIIGTGGIAKTFARALNECESGTLVGVGSRSQESADKFGAEFQVPNRHATYESLLADSEVDAIYISTPHPLHAKWAIASARAGKHVLCEKPLGMSHAQAMAITEACADAGVIFMEAFMYRCHPQARRVAEMIREGAIGRVQVIEASFGFRGPDDPKSRLMDKSLGGGGILDVGCYTISMVRLLAGAALGRDFAEPQTLKAVGHLGATGADEWTATVLKFEGDILARVACGVRCNLENVVRVFGENGILTIPSPWFCGPTDGAVKITVQSNGQSRDEIIETDRSLYAYEADAFAQAVREGQVSAPAMGAEDSIGNARALDLWRGEIGLSYAQDTLEGNREPLSGQVLAPAQRETMKYGRVPGVEKEVSKLVLGTMFEGVVHGSQVIGHAFALLDFWIERGGNAFDTAHIYGGSMKSEAVFGHWLSSRGLSSGAGRDGLFIIAKGAHTPDCHPEGLSKQLGESLERMQISHADLYMMHRDNLEIPVSEFVDVLNEHRDAGRITSFGGSNWSFRRIEEANAYAKQNGLIGFTAVSNNFSLARLVQPVWYGSISSSDAESKRWLEETQTAIFAWSSQARGFFARGNREFLGDAELARCWYSDDNFERLERVQVLARERGVLPINIAAAYVLSQQFPAFALIGPRALSEIRTSLPALQIELSAGECTWLNLESDTRD